MSDFEEVKRNAVHSFASALRSSPLAGQVDQQRIVLALAKVMEPLDETSVFDLTELYQFLISQELDPKAVAELLIFFHSRADAIKIPMSLPAEVDALSQGAKDAAIERFHSMVSDSVYKREVSAPKAKVPGPPPGESSGRQKTMSDDMKKGPERAGPNPLLLVALAVAMVGAGGIFFSARGGGPSTEVIQYVDDPAGVGCTNVIGGKNGAVCEIPKAAYEAMDVEEFKTRAQMTVKKLKAAGYAVVIFRTAEDKKLLAY